MESLENEEDINDKIKVLNKVLLNLQKERKKSEKEEIIFNKRYRVLNIEKELNELKRKRELKSLEKKQKVRTSISHDKNILNQKKINDKKNLEQQKLKNVIQKNNISKSLEVRKRNFFEKNRKEAEQLRQEKASIKKCLIEMNKENLNKKKEIHDNALINQIRLINKKQTEKVAKNLMVKNELKKQIEKEIEKIGRINKFAKNEEEINKILKMYPNNNRFNQNKEKNT